MRLPRHLALSFIVAGAWAASAAPAAAAEAVKAPVAVQFVGRRGSPTLQLRLADTPAAHARGLMHVRELAADDGMLFVFARPERRAFWMKNTFVSLDMVFVGADCRVVGIVANAVPHDEAERGVPAESQYVVELAGGSAARLALAAGDTVRFVAAGRQCPPAR